MEWKYIKLWVMLHAKFVWMWHRRRGSALCVARLHSVNARLWSFHQLVGFSCKVKRVSHVRIVYLLRLRWTPPAALLLKHIWLIHLHHWNANSNDFSIVNSWCGTLRFDNVPWAGGEGSGEGRDEAWQETEGVLACEAEVDEGQDDASVDNVAQDWGKDVFSQTSDQ